LAYACLLVFANVGRADFGFGEPVHMGSVINTASGDAVDCFSPDGLEMYIDSDSSGGHGDWDIWISRRATTDDEWGLPENLGPKINSPQEDSLASISADGLSLYFTSGRDGTLGGNDIWVTTRESLDSPWAEAVNLGPAVNGEDNEGAPWISTDGLTLYFNSVRDGGLGRDDIWVTTRATHNDPWTASVNLGPPVNGPESESFPALSADGLLLFFNDQSAGPFRAGGYGGADLWVSMRKTADDRWGTPVNLGPRVNSASADGGGRLSPDGWTFYFGSEREGGLGGTWGDIWSAPILPVVDFNGDGAVDVADICIMVDHWETDEPLCDIGPMAWGDGIVDVEDLLILLEHIDADLDDPTLAAHWALDETAGPLAFDSVSGDEALAVGGVNWHPGGGQVDGAVELDGVDDVVVTTPIAGLSGGPFSVVLWVQGGAPGQVILAQQGAANWLYLDPDDGTLVVGLMAPGRNPTPLHSDATIADGQWHQIGLVWDGTRRILCVDGEEAASDEQERLALSETGLNIGCGGNLAPGSFFAGLIDDVRIYNRAVKP
jgi:hypothetical protein